jgi:hypothetical protein
MGQAQEHTFPQVPGPAAADGWPTPGTLCSCPSTEPVVQDSGLRWLGACQECSLVSPAPEATLPPTRAWAHGGQRTNTAADPEPQPWPQPLTAPHMSWACGMLGVRGGERRP